MVSDKEKKMATEKPKEGESSKYINPLTDFGFKYLFGAKDLLIDFLNSVLDIDGGIKDLQYVNTEKTPRSAKERKSVLDLHCITKRGEHVIIEIQYQRHKNFIDRILIYITDTLKEQAKKGKDVKIELAPLYSVNILDFCIDRKKTDKSVSYVQLIDRDTKEVFYKKLTLVFMELPRFRKNVHELQTGRDVWMFVLKNLKKLERMPDEIRNEVFEKLFQMAEIAALSEEDRKEYYQSLYNYNKMNLVIEEKNKTINVLRRRNAAYRQDVAAYQQREAAYKQENTAYKREIAELRRLLDLNGEQVN